MTAPGHRGGAGRGAGRVGPERGTAAWSVAVADQLREPGSRRHVAVRGPLPGARLTAASVPEDAEACFDGTVEALADGRVVATGQVRAPYRADCRRCLGPVTGEIDVAVQEVFERSPVEGETYRLDGETVDLEVMARDAVLLALPLAPLCRPDCPGPDAAPIADAGDEGAAHDEGEERGDPRWAALRELHIDE